MSTRSSIAQTFLASFYSAAQVLLLACPAAPPQNNKAADNPDDIQNTPQAPEEDIEWLKQFSGPGRQTVSAVASSKDGSTYITGYLQRSINFGSGPLSTQSGQSNLGWFLSRLDNQGNVTWSKLFADDPNLNYPQNQLALDLALDSEENVVVVGYAAGRLDLGADIILGEGGFDAFVAKFSAQGELRWGQLFGGPGNQSFNGVAIDSQDAVLLTGWFSGTIEIGEEQLSSETYEDILIAKLDAHGVPLWARSFGDGSDSVQRGTRVAVDTKDDVYLLGDFSGTLDFDGTELRNVDWAPHMFLSKFSPSAEHLWSRHLKGESTIHSVINSEGLSISASDEVIIAGTFTGEIHIDDELTLQSAGGKDIFVAKFDSEAKVLWQKSFGGAGEQRALGLSVDSMGQICIAAWFSEGIAAGNTPLSTIDLGIFVGGIDPTGTLTWTHTLVGGSQSLIRGELASRLLAKHPSGGLMILAGSFEADLSAGTTTLFNNSADDDAFALLLKAQETSQGD